MQKTLVALGKQQTWPDSRLEILEREGWSVQFEEEWGGLAERMKADSNRLFLAKGDAINWDEMERDGVQKAKLPEGKIVIFWVQDVAQLPQEVINAPNVDIWEQNMPSSLVQKRLQWLENALSSQAHIDQLENQLREVSQQLEGAASSIRTASEEKNVLMQEIHHRVKNNLQMVSSILTLQTSKIEDRKVRELLKNAQSRVDTISLIHKKLYESESLAEINVNDYIQQQIKDLMFHFPERSQHVDIQFDIASNILLDIDRSIHLALLLNELIVNALIHAFPDSRAGAIRIQFHPDPENSYLLMVSDNGIGLPKNMQLEKSTSTGMRVIMRLVKQLEGAVKVAHSPGTSYQITFPR